MSLFLNSEVVKCRECKSDSTFYSMSINEYGSIIGRTESSSVFARYVIANNPIYEDFVELLNDVLDEHEGIELDSEKRIDCIRELFSIACDPYNGEPISFVAQKRMCRCCGSSNFLPGLVRPVSLESVNEFEISHDNWKNIDKNEKKALLIQALDCYLLKHRFDHLNGKHISGLIFKYSRALKVDARDLIWPFYNDDGHAYPNGKTLFRDSNDNLVYEIRNDNNVVLSISSTNIDDVMYYVVKDVVEQLFDDAQIFDQSIDSLTVQMTELGYSIKMIDWIVGIRKKALINVQEIIKNVSNHVNPHAHIKSVICSELLTGIDKAYGKRYSKEQVN